MPDGATHISDQDPRPAWQALVEVAVIAASLTLVAGSYAAMPADANSVQRMFDAAASGGVALEGHIGWALGVYVPTLLGFYAIVVGGQLLGNIVEPTRTRFVLAMTAELMAGALAVPVLMIVAACAAGKANIGVLFVLLPCYFLVLFLASQLGRFLVLDRDRQLEYLDETRISARARLRTLSRRSRRPVWAVLLVNAAGAAVLGIGISAGLGTVHATLTAMLCIWAAALVVTGSLVVSSAASAGWVSSIPYGFAYAMFCGSATWFALYYVAAPGLHPAGIAILSTTAYAVLTTFLPPPARPRSFVLNWSVRGAGLRLAARASVRTYAKANREFRRLAPPPAPAIPDTPVTLYGRLRRAAQAFAARS